MPSIDGPRDSDAALVARVLARDPAACRELARRVKPVAERRVRSVLLRARGRGLSEASRALFEDAMQEVLLTLYKDDARLLRSFSEDKGERLDPFVGAVATNVALNVIAKSRRRARRETPAHPESLEAKAASEGPRSMEARAEARDVAARLLADLDPTERAMVIAYFGERRSASEVAAQFGRTERAVQVWASRMRQRLKRRYPELSGELQ